MQQGGTLHPFWLSISNVANGKAEALARIRDIVHDNDLLPVQRLGQSLGDLGVPGRGRSDPPVLGPEGNHVLDPKPVSKEPRGDPAPSREANYRAWEAPCIHYLLGYDV